MGEHRFQINLRGIIDLLSNHLYSSPNVYVRELLQNATDAIRARALFEGETAPAGEVEVRVGRDDRGRATIVVTDNGIGLTEEETHRFLATIGESSKRDKTLSQSERDDFIGQFGIGLLSCFVVSDEIAVLTRSARGGPAVTFRGRADGEYDVSTRDSEGVPIGTTVHLVCKASMDEWAEPDMVRSLLLHFGRLLPFRISLTTERGSEHVNAERPPWERTHASAADARAAYLAFGERVLKASFVDAIPLRSDVGDIQGVAYVLPYSPSPTALPAHRVYLKQMLLSEKAENLLPRWAFFVVCVLNTNDLRPTASRESFYEDDNLTGARSALGDALRRYLLELREEDPQRLQLLVQLHFRAIKALAAHDAEFMSLFIDELPFETSMGTLSFREIRAEQSTIRYAPSVDAFRQIAQVAAAQGMGVINGGYSYDIDLLERVPDVFKDLTVERVEATDLVATLAHAEREEELAARELLAVANETLAPYECRADLRAFAPAELPVLYTRSADATFARQVEHARASQETASKKSGDAGSIWGGVLDQIATTVDESHARLFFNYSNPLVRRLTQTTDRETLALSISMLYVQALLLGHHPLRAEELSLLNVGMMDLISRGLRAPERQLH